MDLSILSKLSLIEDNLTKKERRVVEYIVNNGDQVMHMRIEELARATDIGYSPIYSLIKKIGFNGYREFIISFTAERVQIKNNESERNNDNNLLEQYNSLIARNLKLINSKENEELVHMIIEAKNIYICAFGDTSLVAQELSNRLRKTGLTAFSVKSDADEMLSMASSLTKDDLWLVYSMSGTTKIIINATKIAKERGAKIYVATSKENSELLEFADKSRLVITTATYEQSRILLSTIIPLILLNDQIIATLINRSKKYEENAQKVSNLVIKYN
ncbi:MurR/RpiR family transcriptional regulator [Spiroplasma endosymbiont of Labia minor]|uniref:MurR/RpiR family transcriptional regulator n=1 Tax=Spiroplasma endosymbiont of Labia minor TaxID=3066305 RepID=UPI0030CDC83E